jgi:membrane protein
VGGTLWQAAFWGYTTFQIGVAKYNAIYTSFAALPVFLVWLYVSWVVALFGAEVAFATGHLETYRKALQHFTPSAEARERLALRVYLAIARAFHMGERPETIELLATETKVPVKAVREIVTLLLETGHLSEVQGLKAPAYQPARDLAKVTPGMILATVRKQGDDVAIPEGDPLWQEAVNEANVVSGSLGGLKLSHSMAEILERQGKSPA